MGVNICKRMSCCRDGLTSSSRGVCDGSSTSLTWVWFAVRRVDGGDMVEKRSGRQACSLYLCMLLKYHLLEMLRVGYEATKACTGLANDDIVRTWGCDRERQGQQTMTCVHGRSGKAVNRIHHTSILPTQIEGLLQKLVNQKSSCYKFPSPAQSLVAPTVTASKSDVEVTSPTLAFFSSITTLASSSSSEAKV